MILFFLSWRQVNNKQGLRHIVRFRLRPRAADVDPAYYSVGAGEAVRESEAEWQNILLTRYNIIAAY